MSEIKRNKLFNELIAVLNGVELENWDWSYGFDDDEKHIHKKINDQYYKNKRELCDFEKLKKQIEDHTNYNVLYLGFKNNRRDNGSSVYFRLAPKN